MTLYAALLYYPADRDWLGESERPFSPDYAKFGQDAVAAGVLRGGEALQHHSSATTISIEGGKGGDLLITDGPYAEVKEVLGGFYLIEVADLDEAISWAAKIPAAWRGRVEIRPVAAVATKPPTEPASTPAAAQ